ncbi:MAG: amino acid permease [Candidatus Poseidoniaceae archaeon]|jgi:amino acid transporter|nr:amino acid permease [Candidatus Poseidoniaceae archaeon]
MVKQTASKLLKGDVAGVAKDISDTFKRTIGLSGVVIISLSSMLGSGLFVMPTFAADIMGPGIWLAFLLAASIVLPGALSKAELSSSMPSSGGSYVYLEKTYGPLVGTISGIGLWASFMLKASFALIGFSAYMYTVTTYFDFELNTLVVSFGALILITIVNILGIKKVKAIQTPILVVTLGLLFIICIAALFDPSTDLSKPWDGAFSADPLTIAETSAFVFVAYAGVTKVAAIGGEVKEPERNLPYGMLLSLLIATILYCIITFMMMATIPGDWWVSSDGTIPEDPIYIFVNAVAGSKIGVIAAVLAILTMISMALAGILAASRFLFAMARDNLLPQSLEEVNAKFETPHWPIIVTALAMGLAIFYLPVKDVAKLASGFKIMIFMAINSCVIVLRKTSDKHDLVAKYKSPMYPYIQLWGIFAGLGLIIIMGEKAFIGAGAALVVGILTYYGYGKKHAHPRETPFHSFRKQFVNPTPSEHDKRLAVFHAADFGGKNHLTLKEFQNALKSLGFKYNSDESRLIFHKGDTNEDGVIDIDEFIDTFEKMEE